MVVNRGNPDEKRSRCLSPFLAPLVDKATSPLYYAASFGYTALVKSIVDYDNNQDLEHIGGSRDVTPLQVPCIRKQRAATMLLLEAAADPLQVGQKDLAAVSALEIAGSNQWTDMVHLMEGQTKCSPQTRRYASSKLFTKNAGNPERRNGGLAFHFVVTDRKRITCQSRLQIDYEGRDRDVYTERIGDDNLDVQPENNFSECPVLETGTISKLSILLHIPAPQSLPYTKASVSTVRLEPKLSKRRTDPLVCIGYFLRQKHLFRRNAPNYNVPVCFYGGYSRHCLTAPAN